MIFQSNTDNVDCVVIPKNQRQGNDCEKSEIWSEPGVVNISRKNRPDVNSDEYEWEYIENRKRCKEVEVWHSFIVPAPVFKRSEHLVVEESHKKHDACLGNLTVPNVMNKLFDVIVQICVSGIIFVQENSCHEAGARKRVNDTCKDTLSLKDISIC